MKNKLFLMTLLTTFGWSSVEAAVVYMKDGTQKRGTIVSATARDIQLSSTGGIETVTTDKISRIDYSDTTGSSEPTPSSASVPPRAETLPPSPRVRRPYYNFDQHAVWPKGTEQWLSLGFGVGIPMSRVDFESTGGGRSSNGGAGFQFTPQYLVKLNPQWGAGFEFNYFARSENLTQTLLPNSDTLVSGSNITLLPILKYSLVERGAVRPYVSGGVGAQRTSTFVDAQPNVGFAWSDTNTDEIRTLVDDAHWGLATSLRLGVDFSAGGPSVFGLEFGWNHLENDAFTPTRAGKDLGLAPLSGVQNNLAMTFRWGWRF